MKDYNVISTDRLTNKGGTATLVKRNIDYELIFTPSSRNNALLEFTIIKLKYKRNNLFIISAYATNSNQQLFITKLNDLFEKLELSSLNNYFILAGDLNSRHTNWGDENSN